MDSEISLTGGIRSNRVKVVVATTVALTFISYWRAAAIVLNDLASSAFYVGGIAEKAIGRTAPWFILAVMLFSYAVRAVYVESCAMFVRGGVYRVVKEAMGGTLAKLSVSALMFDYILTGPISGVSAGQYLVGLVITVLGAFGLSSPIHAEDKVAINLLAALIAILVVIYFWWQNIKGIHESSDRALRIMQITTVMVAVMIVWCLVTLFIRGSQAVPLPIPANLAFNDDALGWLKGWHYLVPRGPDRWAVSPTAPTLIGLFGILMAFGHSVLAMSGEESLAQVNRELEHPKLKNLRKAGLVIFVFSLLFTSLVSFFAVMIIPNDKRPEYFDNLIAGLAMNVVGPITLKLIFQAFVVIVGFLILAGAVNTAIVGSNGVLNRVSEDGVLTDWFRKPQKKFGTTYRIINLVAGLQILTVIVSRGDVFLLGEAYAFGVIWSFTFNAFSMLVLRFKDKSKREWKVPINIRLGKIEIPIGLSTVALMLLFVAVTNILTKQIATISGLAFTIVFYIIFTISEKYTQAKKSHSDVEQFNLIHEQSLSKDVVGVRPGGTLVPVRDYNNLVHLIKVLEETDTEKRDVVVMTTRVIQGPNAGEQELEEHLFTDYEQRLFTKVVSLAEKFGKKVELVTVPSKNPMIAILQTARHLECYTIVMGVSAKMTPDEQARELGRIWEMMSQGSRPRGNLRIIGPDVDVHFQLGPHAPRLAPEDIELVHRLWLDLVGKTTGDGLHHNQIVTLALRRLRDDLKGKNKEDAVKQLKALVYNADKSGKHTGDLRKNGSEPEESAVK
ncbi:MAG TPA: APC family permease [Blastocatellia bacterium]|nr:APC family permease [Blastocatellia bacterium]